MSEINSAEKFIISSSRVTELSPDRVTWIRIGEDSDGQRVDNFFLRVAKGVPKSHIYRLLRSGEVRVNKKRVKAETRLALDDIVRVPPIRVPQKRDLVPRAAPISDDTLPILFEDEHLLIVDKPAGLACHGGSGIAFGLISGSARAARISRSLSSRTGWTATPRARSSSASPARRSCGFRSRCGKAGSRSTTGHS